jgi:hypothetical protein
MAATGLRDHAQTCAICWNGSVDTGPDEPTRERAPDHRSQRFLNHVWLFWLPWGSGLTIPNQQRRERFNGATPFLPHGSTP